MAKKSRKDGLTKLELKLMQVVWKRGRATVGRVQQDLEPPLAYTTVQTMLNLLERKGKLKRELEGRFCNTAQPLPRLFAAGWLATRILHSAGSVVEHRVWVVVLLLQGLLPASLKG
jgi:predicted transcriptional regulator